MAQTLSELSTEGRVDPDAQATVHDFLDYTEFFPSDLFRSLSLIGKLDESYQTDTLKIHDLTKTYATLPSHASETRPDPQVLRNDISKTLDQAVRSRESAFAEATRLCNSADTLYNRLVNITEKLKALPKPPSRDPSPDPQTKSPTLNKSRKGEGEKPPKITLLVDGNKAGSSNRQMSVPHRQKYSSRRVIVPGEVLPPFDPISPGAMSSDSESEASPTPPPTQFRSNGREKIPKGLKLDGLNFLKTPKLPKSRLPRPPGAFGTNVHSGVAGISVSNAMALLPRPPENPVPGSVHAPWNDLTEWELNMIRKRMKKNAVWQPSETMKQRELAAMGRGKANYEKAKAMAEAKGEEFVCDSEPDFSRKTPRERRFDDTEGNDLQAQSLLNRGMKLNEAKKLKRESLLKEQAARDKQTQDDFIRQIAQAQSDLAMSWEEMAQLNKQVEALATPNESQKKLGKSLKKRKRSSSAAGNETGTGLNGSPVKKLKISYPSTSTSKAAGVDITSPTTNVASAVSPTKAPATAPAVAPSITLKTSTDKEPETPSLPSRPTRATAKLSMPAAKIPMEPATAPGPSRKLSLNFPKDRFTEKGVEKETTDESSSTERSSRRTTLRLNPNGSSETTTKTSSEATKDSPAPTPSAQTAASRREKRPIPGPIVSNGADGSAKISLGLPKKASTAAQLDSKRVSLNNNNSDPVSTSKQAKVQAELLQHGAIDNDEDRYCICGGVSDGPMVACDNDCEKAWFHWECVGMTEMPKRTQKWYCPDCREALGVTEYGVPIPGAKGRKKGRAR